MCFLGIVQLYEKGNLSWWHILAAILLPFIRFEGLAMALLTIAILFYKKANKTATIISVVIASGMIAWAIFMRSMDLPFFPSSILVHSSVTTSAVNFEITTILKQIIYSVWGSLFNPAINYVIIFLITSLFTAYSINTNQKHIGGSLYIFTSGIIIFHLLFGKNGAFY